MNPTTGAPLNLQMPPPGGDLNLWGLALNANAQILNAQTFSLGNPVPTAGLNINAPLSLNGQSLTNVLGVDFFGQAMPLATAVPGLTVDTPLGNLWFTDEAGNQIQLTLGGALNVGSVGGISGMTGTTASVAYSNATGNFFFSTAGGNTPAQLSIGPLNIGQFGVASPNFVTLQSPDSLAGDYSITLLAALPGQTNLLLIGSGGQLTAPNNPTVAGALTVGSLATTAGASIGTTLAVGTNATVAGTLAVTGASTMGAITMGTGDNFTLGSSAEMILPSSSSLSVSGPAVFSGVVNNGQTFALQGPATNTSSFTGTFFAATTALGTGTPTTTELKSSYSNNHPYAYGYVKFTGPTTVTMERIYNATVSRSGIGTYVISFKQPLYTDSSANLPAIALTVLSSTAGASAQVTSIQNDISGNWATFTVQICFNDSGSATPLDADLMFTVI